jgi:predicted dehydrogenase
MAETRRLKVGVVGAGLKNSPDGREGWAARAHLPALKALPEIYEVAAVCTTRMETARAAAEHFSVPQAFDNVARMLAALPDLDVVCCSVRPPLHLEVVTAALHAGKHVYCEQPLGISTAQARAMHDLAARKGLRTVLGHQSHYEPAALHMAELVRGGYIGRPLSFSHSYFVANYIAPRPPHRQWLFQSAMGGHPGYRSGHSLERVLAVMGSDVERICADMAILVPERRAIGGGVIASDQVDNMNYLLRMKNGAMGTMQTSFTAWSGTGNRFEIYGTEGMLMLASGDTPGMWDKGRGAGDPTRGESRLYGTRVDVEKLLAEPTAPERLQRQFEEIAIPERHVTVRTIDRSRATFTVAQMWVALARAIHEGHECAPSFRDKLKIHYIWDAAERSAAGGAWVNVDYHGVA